jgi:hypothetical protein
MRARFGENDVALASGDASVRVLDLAGTAARIESQGREETVHFALEGNVVHLARGRRELSPENTLLAPRASAPGKSATAGSRRR